MRARGRCVWQTGRTRCTAAPSLAWNTASTRTVHRTARRPNSCKGRATDRSPFPFNRTIDRLTEPKVRRDRKYSAFRAGALGEVPGALCERRHRARRLRRIGARSGPIAHAADDALKNSPEAKEIVRGVIVHVRRLGAPRALQVHLDILVHRRNAELL